MLLSMVFLAWQSLMIAVASADLPLDRRIDLMEQVKLPESEPYEETTFIPISGPWRLVSSIDGVRTWEAPLPIRTRSLFFFKPPPDMSVYSRKNPNKEWTKKNQQQFSKRTKPRENKWNYSSNSIRVFRRIDQGPPPSWAYALKYAKASEREKILADYNTTDPKNFVVRQQQIGDQTKHGLYLPTPTTIDFKVKIPENSIFQAQVTIIPPEAADPIYKSDGVDFIVEAVYGGKTISLLKHSAQISRYEQVQIKLDEYVGKEITLRLRSESENKDFDYLFIADPIVKIPKENPKKVIWIFIDTLRQDHMGVYGYQRPTTPKLDSWSKGAAVYTQARSIAPWTLPSARTMVTGEVPEKWGLVPTIQEQFSKQGWNTVFLAGNIYLSSNFNMTAGWTIHRCVNWPLAEVQISRAKEILAAEKDRNVFMMLHLMDMHLPYTEPLPYRYVFADQRPVNFTSDSFGRSEVARSVKKHGSKVKNYVIDRYDNNLRYIDDVLSSFLSTLPEDSTVVLFSDHGEEFWDHNGFEHGHSLYDELLKIPLIVKSPGIEPGLFSHPVSLLDLTPTTADLAGVPIQETTGWSLTEHSPKEFTDRPQAFGRKLYGDDSWASLHHNSKYITNKGNEISFDIADDPKEQEEIRQSSLIVDGREALGVALDREVQNGIRITLKRSRTKQDATVMVTFPSGIKAAWRGSNPTKNSKMTLDYTDDTAVFVWEGKNTGMREAFIVPEGDMAQALSQMQAFLIIGDEKTSFTQINSTIPTFESRAKKLFRSSNHGRVSYITYMVMPIPNENDQEIDAFDDEVSEELKILGYVE